jgi:hypothetical protein
MGPEVWAAEHDAPVECVLLKEEEQELPNEEYEQEEDDGSALH